MRTRIKICCITNPEDLRLAVRAGADAVGIVGPMPSGTGIVDLATAARLARLTPPPVASFLLTSATDPGRLVEEAREVAPSVLQIVDRVGPEAYRRLRAAAPGLRIVQVVHVAAGAETLAEAREAAALADAVLLDSGSREGPVARLGGTGKVHDWAVSRRIVEEVGAPVFLAGGLTPENVGRAIRAVRPYGVDLCTGLRTDERLDPAKLDAFVAAVTGAGTGA